MLQQTLLNTLFFQGHSHAPCCKFVQQFVPNFGVFFSLSSSLTLAFMREEWVVFFSVTHLSKTHRFPSVVWSRLLPAEPLKGATCIYNSVSRGRMEQSSVRCTDGPRLTQTMGGEGVRLCGLLPLTLDSIASCGWK